MFIPRHFLEPDEIDRYNWLLEEDRRIAAEAFSVTNQNGLWALASDDYTDRAKAGWLECEGLRDRAWVRECAALGDWWTARGLPEDGFYLVDMRPEVHVCWSDYDLTYSDVILQARQILIGTLETISSDDIVSICSEQFPNLSLNVIMPAESAFYTRLRLDRMVIPLAERHRALTDFHA